MFQNKLDSYVTSDQPTDYDEIGRISFKKAKILPYFIIRSAINFGPVKFDQDELDKYVTFNW